MQHERVHHCCRREHVLSVVHAVSASTYKIRICLPEPWTCTATQIVSAPTQFCFSGMRKSRPEQSSQIRQVHRVR